MNFMKKIWSALDNPLLILSYAVSCIFMLLIAFDTNELNYSEGLTIKKAVVIIFSLVIISKGFIMAKRYIKNKSKNHSIN